MLSLEHGGCIHSSDVELRSDRTALVSNKSGNFRQKDGEKLSGDKKTERMTTMGDSIPQLTAKKKKKNLTVRFLRQRASEETTLTVSRQAITRPLVSLRQETCPRTQPRPIATGGRSAVSREQESDQLKTRR